MQSSFSERLTGFFYANRQFGLVALLTIIIYFPIFLHLTQLPIHMWDESTTGVIANEMRGNHNYIVTYFFGSPNMEYRPPLMPWCIIFFSRMLGFSELSLRLPSALAAFALCMYIFAAFRKYCSSSVFGFITACILVTSQGFIRNHVTRTGEYDSLLVFFSTVSSLNLFFAFEDEDARRRSWHIFGFFFFITLALLSKGTFCFVALPALFIFGLIKGKLLTILKQKSFYSGLAFLLFFGVGYYLLREAMNPGYIKAVWYNELGGRFNLPLQGHDGPYWYYLRELTDWQFVQYYLIFPIALFFGLVFVRKEIRNVVLFALLQCICLILILSKAVTKLPHYDAIMFPYLAIIIASFFDFVVLSIRQKLSETYRFPLPSVIALLFFFAIWIPAYIAIIGKVYSPKNDPWEDGFYNQCEILRDAAKHETDITGFKVVYNLPPIKGLMDYYGPPAVLACYQQELNGQNVAARILISTDSVKINDKVIAFDPAVKEQLSRKFKTTTLKHIDQYNADEFLVTE